MNAPESEGLRYQVALYKTLVVVIDQVTVLHETTQDTDRLSEEIS